MEGAHGHRSTYPLHHGIGNSLRVEGRENGVEGVREGVGKGVERCERWNDRKGYLMY